MGFSKGKLAPAISPELEQHRHQPHLLLATLQHSLLMEVGKATGAHYEGLAAAGRAARPAIGNTWATKLRLVDEAHNLIRHLSPESCAICIADLVGALAKDKALSQTPNASTTMNTGTCSSIDEVNSSGDDCSCSGAVCEVQRDKLEAWWSAESNGNEIAGDEAQSNAVNVSTDAVLVPRAAIDAHVIYKMGASSPLGGDRSLAIEGDPLEIGSGLIHRILHSTSPHCQCRRARRRRALASQMAYLPLVLPSIL